MSRGDIARQEAKYRRGVVLGLTIAEAMLLILFALLLALGFLLRRADEQDRLHQTALQQSQLAQQRLQAKVEVLEAIVDDKPTDDFIRELVQARQAQQAVKQRERQLVEREKAVAKAEEILAAIAEDPDKKARTKDLAAVGARLEKAMKGKGSDKAQRETFDLLPDAVALAEAARTAGLSVSEARDLLQNLDRATREIGTQRGQIVKLRRDLAKVGRGGDLPPCWITETGEIQFLFDIRLNSDSSLTVRNVTPAARLVDYRDLRLDPALTAAAVNRDRFLASTAKLYEQSKVKECRHYVIVRDATGPTQKDLFKRLLIHTVEARFYKVIRG